MLNKCVGDFIKQHQLLSYDKRYIVALSGGADSIALSLILKELRYDIEAAHCNFNLRGEESMRDEAFVVDFCQQHNIPLHRIHFDTCTYAALHKVSIEMAARELRYHYFEQLRCDIGADGICVAHHRDDSVETMLMNLIHGTGIHGLIGIRPRNGYILRPLLCVSRQQIETWLRERNQPFMTDSSNLEDNVLRNKIRLNLIPLLKKLNPAVMENMRNTMQQASEAENIYNTYILSAIKEIEENNTLKISELLKLTSSESILFEWLRPYGFQPSVVRDIYRHLTSDAQTGNLWQSSTHDVIIDRDRLIVELRQEALPTLRIPETGTYNYQQQQFSFKTSEDIQITRAPHSASLDAAKVHFPLYIRPVREGDRFSPFGMKGSKLLSDYMTDLKFSLFDKRRQLVVTDCDNQIVWVVGSRPDNRFCITPSTTKVLNIRLSE